jgi:ABC-type microcin C transport system permease subunit YejB
MRLQCHRPARLPVMQGVFLVITMSVILANLLADFLYGWLDPRASRSAERHLAEWTLFGSEMRWE